MKKIVLILIALLSTNLAFAVNYSQPESAVYDAVRQCYYISNVGVQGTLDGTIIKRDLSGATENLLPDFLNDPKGMVIVGDTLYVTDVNKLVYINLVSRQVVGSTQISTLDIFLNDIAADLNYLYLSETAFGRIYRVPINNPKSYEAINFQGTLASPNGLYFDASLNRLIIVTFHANANIMALNLETMELTLLKTTDTDYLDGITRDNVGNYFISSWGALPQTPTSGKIYKFSPDFSSSTVYASGFNGPADILFDTTNNVLVVPISGDNAVRFIVLGTNLPTPLLISPVNNLTGVGNSISLVWEQVPGAASYLVQLSKSPAFNPIETEIDLQATQYEAINLGQASKYYWRVRALGQPAASDWSEVRNFTTSGEAIAPPQLIMPPNGELYSVAKPTFLWNSTPEGLYRFQLWRSATLQGRPIIEVKSLMDTTVSLTTDLIANQTYYWRVQTFSGFNTSEWSELWSFHVANKVFPAPKLYYPGHNSHNVPLSPIFIWSNQNADNYGIQISKLYNFNQVLYKIDNLTDTTYIHPIPFEPNTRYYWRVRSYSNTSSIFSDIFSFVTLDPTGVGESPASFVVRIFPNPASEFINICSDNDFISQYEIFSLEGKFIVSQNDLNTNEILIKTNHLPKGEYFILLLVGNQNVIKRFIVF